jgi:hypothetical protein
MPPQVVEMSWVTDKNRRKQIMQATTYFPEFLPKVTTRSNKRGRRAIRCWLVIEDPSGDFLGGHFRTFDLNGATDNYWPEGIIFENQTTQERKIWRAGRFFSLQSSGKYHRTKNMKEITYVEAKFLAEIHKKIAGVSLDKNDLSCSSAEVFHWQGKAWIATSGLSNKTTGIISVSIQEVVPLGQWRRSFYSQDSKDLYTGIHFSPKGKGEPAWEVTDHKKTLKPSFPVSENGQLHSEEKEPGWKKSGAQGHVLHLIDATGVSQCGRRFDPEKTQTPKVTSTAPTLPYCRNCMRTDLALQSRRQNVE